MCCRWQISAATTTFETADTFEGNALQKAMFVAERYGRCNVVADDSGLCVDALDGAPGVFSARYAGEGTTPKPTMPRLLAELDGIADRHAHMATAMVFLADAASEPITAVGGNRRRNNIRATRQRRLRL